MGVGRRSVALHSYATVQSDPRLLRGVLAQAADLQGADHGGDGLSAGADPASQRPAGAWLVALWVLIPVPISALTRAFGWLALLSNRGLVNTWPRPWA